MQRLVAPAARVKLLVLPRDLCLGFRKAVQTSCGWKGAGQQNLWCIDVCSDVHGSGRDQRAKVEQRMTQKNRGV